MSIERLGFAADVDMGRATAAVSQMERHMRQLEQAMARANREGHINPVDDRAFGRSISQVERAYHELERTSRDVTGKISTEMTRMAALTTQKADMMARGITTGLQQVDREIDKTTRKLDALNRLETQIQQRRHHARSSVDNFRDDRHHFEQNPRRAQAGGGATGGVGQMLGGLGGMIGLGGVVAYISQAVQEVAGEYVHLANMSTRLAGGRSESGMAHDIHGVGDRLLYSRADTQAFAESLAGAMGSGTTRSGGINTPDIDAGLRFTRGFGLESGYTSSMFGRMGQAGAFKEGDLRRFSREVAAGIDQGKMMPRAAEAIEAAAAVLGGVSERIGNMTDQERVGLLAVQAKLNATGESMFQGQRGASLMGKLNEVIAPNGGDDISETLINKALLTKFGNKMSPYQLMELREGGLSPELLQAVGEQANGLTGGGEGAMRLFQKTFGDRLGFRETRKLFEATGGFKDWGNRKAINEAVGGGVIGAGMARQDGSKAREVREVDKLAEELRHKAGSTFFPMFKSIQEWTLKFANFFVDKIMPGVGSIFSHIQGFMGNLGTIGGQLMGLVGKLGQVQEMLDNPAAAGLEQQAQAAENGGNPLQAQALRAMADKMRTPAQREAYRKRKAQGIMGGGGGYTEVDTSTQPSNPGLFGLGGGAAEVQTRAFQEFERQGLIYRSDRAINGNSPDPIKRAAAAVAAQDGGYHPNGAPKHVHHDGNPNLIDINGRGHYQPGQFVTIGSKPAKFLGTSEGGEGGLYMNFAELDPKTGEPTGVTFQTMHMSMALPFRKGQKLDPGTIVGSGQKYGGVKTGGSSSGPHLHWQAKKNGKLVNARGYFGLSNAIVSDDLLRAVKPESLPESLRNQAPTIKFNPNGASADDGWGAPAPKGAPATVSAGAVSVAQHVTIVTNDPETMRRSLRGAAAEAYEMAQAQYVATHTAG